MCRWNEGADVTELLTGWCYAPDSQRLHFLIVGENSCLCRKWYQSWFTVRSDNPQPADMCAVCKRVLATLEAGADA